jgi:hypothetical protein
MYRDVNVIFSLSPDTLKNINNDFINKYFLTLYNHSFMNNKKENIDKNNNEFPFQYLI